MFECCLFIDVWMLFVYWCLNVVCLVMFECCLFIDVWMLFVHWCLNVACSLMFECCLFIDVWMLLAHWCLNVACLLMFECCLFIDVWMLLVHWCLNVVCSLVVYFISSIEITIIPRAQLTVEAIETIHINYIASISRLIYHNTHYCDYKTCQICTQ